MKPPPEPLDSLLDRWSKTPEPPPRLAADIWNRIALAEKQAVASPAWWTVVETWFNRPPFAALFVACCALLGLFLAEIRVSRQQEERNQQLARSYLQLIDPLLTSQDQKPNS